MWTHSTTKKGESVRRRVYLSSKLPREVEKLVSIYEQDVVVGVTPSEEAVIVYEPLHSTHYMGYMPY